MFAMPIRGAKMSLALNEPNQRGCSSLNLNTTSEHASSKCFRKNFFVLYAKLPMKILREPTPDVKCPIEFTNKLLKQTLTVKPNNTHQTHTDTTLLTFTDLFAKPNSPPPPAQHTNPHTRTYESTKSIQRKPASLVAMYSPYQHIPVLDHQHLPPGLSCADHKTSVR